MASIIVSSFSSCTEPYVLATGMSVHATATTTVAAQLGPTQNSKAPAGEALPSLWKWVEPVYPYPSCTLSSDCTDGGSPGGPRSHVCHQPTPCFA